MAMDTFVSVSIYDSSVTPATANVWIDSVFTEVRRIERMATDYSDSSEVGQINLYAGQDSVTVSEEMISLIRESLKFSDGNGGAFNITVGPMVKLWNFLAENPRPPSEQELSRIRQLVDHSLVAISGNKVFLKKEGMKLDLGGIAKGYAVDRSEAVLRRGGFRSFIIDIGGNLGVFWEGTRLLDSTVAEIYVRHPRAEGTFFGKFKVGTGGVATSGDYQRYFMHDGIRYHHIIDPSTGLPARGAVAVTIVADDALTADALSTLVFVLGRKKGMEFIRNRPGVEGLIIYEEGDSLAYDISPGLKEQFVRSDDSP